MRRLRAMVKIHVAAPAAEGLKSGALRQTASIASCAISSAWASLAPPCA